ncbi:PREDICTED: uncharacterized protein LOC108448704 isoform X2 [Corvus brachyrhynchos]|uniref:uncharacterized protein LOC108448704 isoform X2 n=1 Tax=Corvus brachyrhynchos TaxID=85066 RepID=UPI0008165BF5|nr:PREDICTED: uncharacterized protein LOC108448704 isoform X2 [Corvus brachyrhynchos]
MTETPAERGHGQAVSDRNCHAKVMLLDPAWEVKLDISSQGGWSEGVLFIMPSPLTDRPTDPVHRPHEPSGSIMGLCDEACTFSIRRCTLQSAAEACGPRTTAFLGDADEEAAGTSQTARRPYFAPEADSHPRRPRDKCRQMKSVAGRPRPGEGVPTRRR